MRWRQPHGATGVRADFDHCAYSDISATRYCPSSHHPGSDRGAPYDYSGANNGAYNQPHLAPYLGADVP